jgi:hypothetical protein
MVVILQIGDGTKRSLRVNGEMHQVIGEVKGMLADPWLELTIHNGHTAEFVRTDSVVAFEVRP